MQELHRVMRGTVGCCQLYRMLLERLFSVDIGVSECPSPDGRLDHMHGHSVRPPHGGSCHLLNVDYTAHNVKEKRQFSQTET
jgi:hypothetical protein